MVTRSTTPLSGYEETLRESMKFFHIQSEVVVENSSTTSQLVSFIDSATLVNDEGYYTNPIVSDGASSDTSLGEFLSRPTLIDTTTWSTSDAVGVLDTMAPWYLFLNNSIIKNKLNNYAFIRGKLCLKFLVNGTPFHFGMLRIAYEPNINIAGTGPRISKIRTNPTSSYPLLTSYSQLPGVYLYPAGNAGAELHLPFFLHKSWLPLGSAAEAQAMGLLTLFNGVRLDVASNTASPSLSVQTYAWLEDVELSGSTTTLTLQGATEYDGPISYPASAIARIARQLESIPVISRFARATDIAATAVAKVSSIFGFTNVPNIDPHAPIVPMPFSHLASSEISTPVQKLTLDPKQELSIDPTLHGLGPTDEMCIKHIISQPTILHVFDWNTTNVQGDVLANFKVTPTLNEVVNILDGGSVLRSKRVYHTWLSYVAALFSHWRGDIIFDIEVVCTKFHKGRLQISWDPVATTGATAPSSNAVVTTILDIGERTSASIRVPYHAAYEWLRVRFTQANHYTINSANTPLPTYDNGLLVISVLNGLVSPITPQEVHIVIKIRGADNLEFANPRSFLGEGAYSPHPSFFAVQGSTVMDTMDLVPVDVEFGDNGSKHPHRYDLNFGERVVSLRTLLRRYSLYDTVMPTPSSATRFARVVKSFSRLPPMYGFDPNGASLATGLVNSGVSFAFNAVPTHPITYVSMMYGAMRGGVNFIVNSGDGLNSTLTDMRVQRVQGTTAPTYRRSATVLSANDTSSASAVASALNIGWPAYTGGATFTNGDTNGAMSFYYPQMNGCSFYYSDPTYSMTGNSTDLTVDETVLFDSIVRQKTTSTTTASAMLTTYAAIGVDFTCLWLLCCPTMDYYSANPTTP